MSKGIYLNDVFNPDDTNEEQVNKVNKELNNGIELFLHLVLTEKQVKTAQKTLNKKGVNGIITSCSIKPINK